MSIDPYESDLVIEIQFFFYSMKGRYRVLSLEPDVISSKVDKSTQKKPEEELSLCPV